MYIVTIDGARHITSYVVPPSPLTMAAFAGDTTKVYIDRSQFYSEYDRAYFKKNYKKYLVTAEGKLQRWAP